MGRGKAYFPRLSHSTRVEFHRSPRPKAADIRGRLAFPFKGEKMTSQSRGPGRAVLVLCIILGAAAVSHGQQPPPSLPELPAAPAAPPAAPGGAPAPLPDLTPDQPPPGSVPLTPPAAK